MERTQLIRALYIYRIVVLKQANWTNAPSSPSIRKLSNNNILLNRETVKHNRRLHIIQYRPEGIFSVQVCLCVYFFPW